MKPPPKTIDDLRASAASARAALASAPQINISGAAPSSTVDELLAAKARLLDDAKDLRPASRKTTDRVWRRAQADVQTRFGRRLELDPHEQVTAGGERALRLAREAESVYINLALSPGRTKAALDFALGEFCAAVTQFLNVVTAGWPSAAVRAAQEKKWMEDRP